MAILVFLAITYGLSAALSYFIWSTGGHESPYVIYAIAAMIFPFIGVLTVRFAFGARVRTMGWRRFPLRYLPAALLLIPLVMHAVMLPLALTTEGGPVWQSWLTPGADGLFHPPEARGGGAITLTELARRIAVNAGVGLLVVAVLAFFEEIGWRAWLLPRLAERLGVRGAVIVTALIWAAWHLPFAFSGVFYIENVTPQQIAIIMPIGHLGAGLILGWLWVRTESIWMVALAHGALNNWGQYAFKYMDEGAAANDALLLGAGNLALVLVGLFLLRRL